MLDNISEEGESTPRRRGKKKKKGKSKKGKGRNFLKKYKKLKKNVLYFLEMLPEEELVAMIQQEMEEEMMMGEYGEGGPQDYLTKQFRRKVSLV